MTPKQWASLVLITIILASAIAATLIQHGIRRLSYPTVAAGLAVPIVTLLAIIWLDPRD